MATYSNFSQNFTVCQQDNCQSLVITDISEGFGSGTGEFPFSNIAKINIFFTDISGVTLQYNVSSDYIPVSSQSELTFTFNADISYSVLDGYVSITITYTDSDGDEHSKTLAFFNKCLIECCVNRLITGIWDKYNCNPCDDAYIDMALTSKGLYIAMTYAAACGDYTKATSILTTLQNICSYTNCNCN